MTLILFPHHRPANAVRRRFRFCDEVRIAGEGRDARAFVVSTRATLTHVREALCLRADGSMVVVPERALLAPVVKLERRAA